MLRLPRLALALSPLVALALAACGGGTPPTMQGRSGMLSQTAVAQKCEQAAKGHDKPFVVEWDATDLATFEAKAASDTVFVRYYGCNLEVVDGCKDPVTPGRFGKYGTPQFTSGTTQGFDVKNEGELYAKLPLGAASLSGKVQAGETLHLKYFVSGVATDTRDSIYAGDLASVSACAGATHYVYAYNLGAFELSSTEQSSAEAQAGLGNIGAGGSHSHEQSALGAAGDFGSCQTQDQRSCRAPIRLALRALMPGQNPAGAPPAAGGTTAQNGGDGPGAGGGDGSRADQAKALWDDAKRKHDAGDGQACLDEANKALGFDMRLNDNDDFKELHAMCEMQAGQCDQGTTDLRATLAAEDTKREKQDWQLDKETREVANEMCPSATAKNDADFVLRAARELKTVAAVQPVPDGAKCQSLIDGITQHLKNIKPDASFDGHAYSQGTNQYERAASCVVRASGKCADGIAVLQSQCVLVSVGGCRDAAAHSWGVTMQYARPPITCH
jgi:hypothetical protein